MPKKPKILITIADAGSGHLSAATALTQTFERLYADKFDVKVIDLFKLADVQPFNSVDTVHTLISQNAAIEGVNNALMRFFNTSFGFYFFNWYLLFWELEECERIIKEEEPDLVVSIHPLISMVIKAIKLRGNVKFKSANVITDLVTIFRGWADDSADMVISPTPDAVNTLVKFGVDVSRIVYPLFPIKPSHASFRPKDEVLKELGFTADKTTVLLTGGGVGTKSLTRAMDKLAADERIQLIVLAGRVEALQEALKYRYRKNPRVKIFGYVDNIQDYMHAMDILVGKPGPATILETELFDKKAILTRKIGHQELGNIDYALRNPKFRYIGEDWSKLVPAVDDLLEAEVQQPKNGHRRKFDECDEIVRELVKLV